jgi:GPH family glycoside/pentoside/hexuronide:cation symporter
MDKEKKLPLKTKLGYGVGDLGGNLFFTVIGFWLMNYLTDSVGLSGTFAGIVMMIGKGWDAITDPVVGFLSDKTKTKWGRRRPWIIFGALPLGIAFAYLFSAPDLGESIQLFIWASVTYVVVSTLYTFVNIPYNSLAPEITKNYKERTLLSSYRNIFAVVGTLIGAGAALPIINAFAVKTTEIVDGATVETITNPSPGYMAMGIVFGAVMTISAVLLFLGTKEPPVHDEKHTIKQSIFKNYIDTFKNKPFVLILLTFTFNIVGVTIVQGSLIYYFKYVLLNEGLLTIALIVMLVTSMIFIPIWTKISYKLGKKQSYILGMSIFSIVVLLVFFIGHMIPIYIVIGMMFFAGVGFATHYVMPWAIIPDAVEYDYAQTGKRREGVYYGLWTFVTKVGQAIAGLLIGIVLDAFGYIENLIPQSGDVQFGIRLLIGPITVVFFIIANIILSRYPIDEKFYNENISPNNENNNPNKEDI